MAPSEYVAQSFYCIIAIHRSGGIKFMTDYLAMATWALAIITAVYATITFLLLREQQRKKQKPIIQEFVEIIIYPTIEQLESQKGSFKIGDFMWDKSGFHYYKQKVAMFIDAEKLIYEHFSEAFPKISNKIKNYNKSLEKQKDNLDNFANEIRSLPDFKEGVFERFEEYKRKTKSPDTFFEPNNQNIEYILEDVVNNKLKLNQSNAYCRFWNQNGRELVEFRNREEIKNDKEEVEKGCENLVALADTILKDLKTILGKYRRKYGIIYKELGKWGFSTSC